MKLNIYKGIKRIWVIVWLATSIVVFVFLCSVISPNPMLPFVFIHPEGMREPTVGSEIVFGLGKWSKRLKDLEHEEQTQAHAKWKSELVPAAKTIIYWKNV